MRIKLKPRKCRKCKTTFEPRVKWQEFCQDKCRISFHAEKNDALIRKAIEAGL